MENFSDIYTISTPAKIELKMQTKVVEIFPKSGSIRDIGGIFRLSSRDSPKKQADAKFES